MFDFTEKKFRSLPFERQHKKCAEWLRHLYEQRLIGQSVEKELEDYNQLLVWLGESPLLLSSSLQEWSNCYHDHLKKANQTKREHGLLPSIRTGDRPKGEEPWDIAIYLDHIRSAHNVGSILRTTEALRLGTVYFSEGTPFIDHKQVRDTAMGTTEWLTCYKDRTLKDLKRPIIALETSPTARSLYDFIFPSSFTLVLGNEEFGCSQEVLQEADSIIEIPLRGRKNSLNVANAYALVAGEICRQKRMDRQ